MFHLRESRVLKKIQEGKTAFCTKLNLADPRVAEIAAMSGFDCIWLDMEHVPSDFISVENSIRAAKLYDVDTLVRVAKGSYNDWIKPYEADAAGIMIPHLMSLKEAKEIVYYTKFHPLGRRPIDGGNADAKFCRVSTADYIKEGNERRFNIVQIEDPEPLDELEEICALEGIDMIFFGPADFSHAMGMAHHIMNEETLKARKLVAETARKYGKMAGTVGGLANYKELEAEGYNFISIGADVVALQGYFDNITSSVFGEENK